MKFEDLKDVDFITESLPKLLSKAKITVEEYLNRKLAKSDPIFILLSSLFAIIFQLIKIINDLAKQNLLTYAREDLLNHMGIFAGVDRLQSSSAVTNAKVSLSTARNSATVIKQGTRFHAGDNVYFALDSDVIFLAGETDKEISATCLQVGNVGNDYSVGELNQIVDPQPFLQSISNTVVSYGGADIESDDDYRERIRQAPEKYSTAGSEGAYRFHTKSFSNLIEDVFIISENPSEVDIYPLLENGEIPNADFLQHLQDYLSANKIRPLTDLVLCKQPQIVYYDIDLNYLIANSDSASQASIILAVENAVGDFITWQKSVLGRDINQTELYKRVREAGAKRCEIISPFHTPVPDNAVAVVQTINLNYLGLEND